ncbi:hypothetical protein GCM10022280_00160 [Sphingomonas swuensis]|uniref:Peptidase M15A C-terminal domain-containing protein n=1 Tax=Sphingomonas swuensis TaxID=977800 RepID=A0ABP7S6U4_9SPHN
MRLPAALLLALSCAAPSAAQLHPVPALPPVVTLPLPTPAPVQSWTRVPGWNPAADYVTAGQDEPGYRRWVLEQPWRQSAVRQFHDYLTASGVSFVAPTWQLLRTASDWQRCGAQPFEVPPSEDWPNIVNTLRYVRDHVVPRVGPVEPVSVFRNAGLNRCAGGAPESVHRSMSAVDFVPLSPIDRPGLIRRLCAEHQVEGPRYNAGLGFYTKLRFHVDSWKYRTWGRGDHGEVACPKVLPPAPSVPATDVIAAATGSGATTTRAASVQAAKAAPDPLDKDPLAPLR